MPLLDVKTLLAAKIETTSGTAETLGNADGAENFYNVVFEEDTAMSPRDAQLSYDSLAAIQELRTATIKFKTDLRGDGAAGVPFWASVLLPACGFTNSGGVFSPKTEAPGSNVKTLTMAHYEDGRVKKARGCAGTVKFVFETGKLGYAEWEFKGAWVSMTDASILAPTYPTPRPLRVGNATFTIGSWSPCFEKMEIDINNTVSIRPCATDTTGAGVASAIIEQRRVKGMLNPEAALVATADPYGDWLAPTERALAFSLQDTVDKIAFAAPKFQVMKVSSGKRSGLVTDQIEFACNKSSGNDALTITFSAP